MIIPAYSSQDGSHDAREDRLLLRKGKARVYSAEMGIFVNTPLANASSCSTTKKYCTNMRGDGYGVHWYIGFGPFCQKIGFQISA